MRRYRNPLQGGAPQRRRMASADAGYGPRTIEATLPSLPALMNRFLGFVLITGAYLAAGKMGLALAVVNASATAVWPPTGIAIAATLLWGRWATMAVLVGAFLVNVTTTGDVPTSAAIAAGNALEAIVAALLVERFAGGRAALRTGEGVLRFALLAGLLATTVSASIGVTTLLLGGLALPVMSPMIWLTWWLGDAAGAVLVAPVILTWAARPKWDYSARRTIEAAALLGMIVVVGALVFAGPLGSRPLAFIGIPITMWAAIRFGTRETATATLLLAAIAVFGNVRGSGPFTAEPDVLALPVLQTSMAVLAVMALTVSAIVAERERTRRALESSHAGLETRVRERTSSIQEAYSLLEATFQSTADGILVVDRAGTITRHNQQFATMWRIPADVLASRDDDRAIVAVLGQLARPDAFLAKVRALYSDPLAESFDVLDFKDGRVFERYSKPQMIDGTVVGRVWSFRDVTRRNFAEDEARAATMTRPLVRRMVRDLLNIGHLDEAVLMNIGKNLADESPETGLRELLASYRAVGLGTIEEESHDASRHLFVGRQLFERREGAPRTTCYLALGYLNGVVAKANPGKIAVGTEVECESRGDARCAFVVRIK